MKTIPRHLVGQSPSSYLEDSLHSRTTELSVILNSNLQDCIYVFFKFSATVHIGLKWILFWVMIPIALGHSVCIILPLYTVVYVLIRCHTRTQETGLAASANRASSPPFPLHTFPPPPPPGALLFPCHGCLCPCLALASRLFHDHGTLGLGHDPLWTQDKQSETGSDSGA